MINRKKNRTQAIRLPGSHESGSSRFIARSLPQFRLGIHQKRHYSPCKTWQTVPLFQEQSTPMGGRGNEIPFKRVINFQAGLPWFFCFSIICLPFSFNILKSVFMKEFKKIFKIVWKALVTGTVEMVIFTKKYINVPICSISNIKIFWVFRFPMKNIKITNITSQAVPLIYCHSSKCRWH